MCEETLESRDVGASHAGHTRQPGKPLFGDVHTVDLAPSNTDARLQTPLQAPDGALRASTLGSSFLHRSSRAHYPSVKISLINEILHPFYF